MRRFLKLFDRTFFRMSFQFLGIIFVGFLILIAVTYWSGGETVEPSLQSAQGQ